MKLLGSTKNKITKDNNDHQQDARVLYTFVPNKPFGNLSEISSTNHIVLKAFKSEIQKIKV